MPPTFFPIELTPENIHQRDFILKKIKQFLSISPSKCNLLEIGCGNGRYGCTLGPELKQFIGVDPNLERLKFACQRVPPKSHIEYILGIGEHLPLQKKFDVLLYARTWHFFRDFIIASNQAKEALKRNGIIIILEPTEHTKNWLNPSLEKGTSSFDPEKYNRKMKNLNRAKEFLNTQKNFKILDSGFDEPSALNWWVLKD